MRNLLLTTLAAALILGAFSACSTTVKSPSGRTASISTRTQ